MNAQTAETAVDICVCTFRRPHLADTLRSLARLDLPPGWSMRVIVADNDETPSARALVEQVEKETERPVLYMHAPARNISIARNACLDAADAPFLAFIDDDELAAPGWLAALIAEVENSGADAVLGPVQAVYGDESPRWMRERDFHSTRPVWVNGEIVTGYSCNVLFRRDSTAARNLRFRPELGRSGGEDTVFFSALHRAGGKIAFAPDALLTEAVPPERARFGWLARRRFRSGQTHALLLLEEKGGHMGTRLRCAGLAAAKALFCLLAALPDFRRRHYWFLRAALHAGVAGRLLGKRELEQYGTGS